MKKVTLNKDWLLWREGETEKRNVSLPVSHSNLFYDCPMAVWYQRTVKAENHGSRLFLCFRRVDKRCMAYVNDVLIGIHDHTEEHFSFEITDKVGKEFDLKLSVYSPEDLEEVRRMPSMGRSYNYYHFINSGGILDDVYLLYRPKTYIDNIHIVPDFFTGEVTVKSTLVGDGKYTLTYEISDGNNVIDTVTTTEKSVKFTIPEYKPWTLNDPFLYIASVTVECNGEKETSSHVFGFKDLRVKDGYFYLNGKKTFLRSTHVSWCMTIDEIKECKVMGFQMVRFITSLASEKLLDFCDRNGILVYEECAAAWGMQDYDGSQNDLKNYLNNMIIRDRNHPCIAVFGLFNETAANNDELRSRRIKHNEKVFECGVNHLKYMRTLDNIHLILLSSGRWDATKNIGSFCNPDSTEWECGWGKEDKYAEGLFHREGGEHAQPYVDGVGDVHLYPTVPMREDTLKLIRSLGQDSKPIFLTEYGVGGQNNVHRQYYDYCKDGLDFHSNALFFKHQAEELDKFVEFYCLGDVYPIPEDFTMASIKANAEQRIRSQYPIRANNRICGENMTSYIVANEGTYFGKGSFFPGICDALRDCFAPATWALFVKHYFIYPNTPFEFEAVLCRDDGEIIENGTAILSILGEKGVVYRKEITYSYTDDSFSKQIFKGMLPGLEKGEYKVCMRLKDSVQPTNPDLRLVVADIPQITNKKVNVIGKAEKLMPWLLSNNVTVDKSANLVLVCGFENEKEHSEFTEQIEKCTQDGKTVIVLDDSYWDPDAESEQRFMQSVDKETTDVHYQYGKRTYYRNWLYHFDSYASTDSVFEPICKSGLIELDLLSRVYPTHYLIDPDKPKKTFAAAYGCGLLSATGCSSGLNLGEFDKNNGKLVVNTFHLLENVGTNPAADIILTNLINRYEG